MNEKSVTYDDVRRVYVVIVFSYYLSGTAEEVKENLAKIHISTLSTDQTINVMKYNLDPKSYIVAFDCSSIIDVDPDIIVSNLKNLMTSNIPDKVIEFTLGASIPDDLQDIIPDMNDEIMYTFRLHNSFTKMLSSPYGKVNYTNSHLIINMFKEYEKLMNRQTVYENPPRINPKSSASGSSLAEYMRDFQYDDDDDYKKKKKKRSNKHKSNPYGISKVIRSAKSPKRAYKKHGIIISKKSAIKNDRRMIKDFIDDFIPGNAKWKKKFRKDLLNRWMHVYVITDKQMKHLKKDLKREHEKKKRGKDIQRTLDVTRKLFNVPIDKWNDPTK